MSQSTSPGGDYVDLSDEERENLERITDWDNKVGAWARVLLSLDDDEKPDVADLDQAGLPLTMNGGENP